jgi:hypothetical protein
MNNNGFVKELVFTNYLFIGAFALIIIVSNLFYSGTIETWNKSMGLLVVLALALYLKIRRIKSNREKLDERLQIIKINLR